MGRDTLVYYRGRPIGFPGYGEPHIDYIISFKELGEILDNPNCTQEQYDAAQGEIEMAMVDFS